MQADLAAADANRDTAPWIVTYAHRPLYCSEDFVRPPFGVVWVLYVLPLSALPPPKKNKIIPKRFVPILPRTISPLCAQNDHTDCFVNAPKLRAALEPLFLKHHVDLHLEGTLEWCVGVRGCSSLVGVDAVPMCGVW